MKRLSEWTVFAYHKIKGKRVADHDTVIDAIAENRKAINELIDAHNEHQAATGGKYDGAKRWKSVYDLLLENAGFQERIAELEKELAAERSECDVEAVNKLSASIAQLNEKFGVWGLSAGSRRVDKDDEGSCNRELLDQIAELESGRADRILEMWKKDSKISLLEKELAEARNTCVRMSIQRQEKDDKISQLEKEIALKDEEIEGYKRAHKNIMQMVREL